MAVKAATGALFDFATPSRKRGNRGLGIITQKEKTKMNQAKKIFITISITLLLSFTVTAVPLWADSKEEIKQEKADIRNMAKETLARLYKAQPSAKKAVSKSAGYAVFSNFGLKIFVAGSGTGKGLIIDNKTKKETFMKMIELQAGFGIGIKKFRLVWVFENHKDVTEFINSGWELGGQTSASAKLGDEGGAFAGAMSVSPGIWLYQLTDDGLALELTGKGTKYYKDDDLN
jgi:lipid-binding SYLF domain-containing protein